MAKVPTYLAFLRAINLGPTRPFPKAAIIAAVEGLGFDGVTTHINTGNVRFASRMRSRARLEAALESAFHDDRGFAVPTMVFTTTEFAGIAAEGRALSAERPGIARHYVYLLKNEPSRDVVARVEGTSNEKGEMIVRGRAAHALLQPGYQAGQVDPLNAAKLLEPATSRNLTVVSAIADKWC